MKKIKEIGVKMVFLATFFNSAFGCVVMIKNDSQGKVLIVDSRPNMGEAIDIPKGKHKNWGVAHERLNIDIYINEPHARIYTAQYKVVQKQCATGKERPSLSIEGIKSGKFNQDLFKITGYQDASTTVNSCCSSTME